jgi:hypothetical protein
MPSPRFNAFPFDATTFRQACQLVRFIKLPLNKPAVPSDVHPSTLPLQERIIIVSEHTSGAAVAA